MKRLSSAPAALAVCAALALPAVPAFAASYAGDFSIHNFNPNGQWSYGYTADTTLTAGYTVNLYASRSSASGFDNWRGMIGGDFTPVASLRTSADAYVDGSMNVPGGAGTLHPGPNGQVSIARYTVPAAGSYDVSAVFSGYDSYGSRDVHVLLNGVSLFAGIVDNLQVKSYGGTLTLQANDELDFAVGSNGAYVYDTTGLAATINPVEIATAVPTPAAASAGLALCSVLLAKRRRNTDIA